ncbi:unnamed protein product, partial [Scytosiphon promiscuus]
ARNQVITVLARSRARLEPSEGWEGVRAAGRGRRGSRWDRIPGPEAGVRGGPKARNARGRSWWRGGVGRCGRGHFRLPSHEQEDSRSQVLDRAHQESLHACLQDVDVGDGDGDGDGDKRKQRQTQRGARPTAKYLRTLSWGQAFEIQPLGYAQVTIRRRRRRRGVAC